jgi:hypothetical protein
VRSVDRIFLAGYVGSLQSEGLVVRFLLDRARARGGTIPSPVLLGEIGREYVGSIERYAAANTIPLVRFEKNACKEDVARPWLEAAERDGRYGVVLVGKAQEKAYAWKGRRHGGSDAHPHFVFERLSVFIDHYYFYVRDPDWGHGFIKTNAYAPFPVWVYLNGHEWAKQQAARAGVEFRPMDNGFRSCENEQALAAICGSLGHEHVLGFFARWMGVLPSPFTAAERRRHPYRLSVRQIEISDTRVFDPPAAARGWFEQTIRDQLDSAAPRTSRSCSPARSPSGPRDGFRPRSSTAAWSRSCKRTTSTARSSSTSKTAARYGPRRPSTIPMTSPSNAR